MQAEVDKYVTSAFLWSRQSRGRIPRLCTAGCSTTAL
jgi:hypothetical protein